jgi:hypothetical protein
MSILTVFRHRFWNNDGTVAAGGKVYVYEPGTTTLKNSWTDSTQSSANTNPVILDSKGEADIWTSGLCKINVLQSDNAQVTGYPVDMLGGDGGRELITTDRTYYVATTGSDSNTGLSVGSPFLTIQKAIDVVGSLDMSIYQVTIQVADGTYTSAPINLLNCIGGSVIILGNSVTPANVIVATNSGTLEGNFQASNISTIYILNGMKLSSTGTNAFGIYAVNSFVTYQNIKFGTGFLDHIRIDVGGRVECLGGWEIEGGARMAANITNGSHFKCISQTVTISGTPNFTSYFIGVTRVSSADMFGNTFSGSATGVRYYASLNGVINTSSGGATYFPGNSAGSTETGGQYF